MRRIVLAMAIFCALTSVAEARRGHGRLPWCGIYMNQYFGKNDRSLWIARNWAREGANAGGPAVGVVVVWPHHVGVITGQTSSGGWIVHSGNDGGAVRTRERSLAGVIAYRNIGGTGSAYANLKGQDDALRGRNKHLVALAVEGGFQPDARVPLRKSRARAHLAVEVSSVSVSSGSAMAFASPAKLTREIGAKQRKTVMQRERMLFSFFTPVPDPVMTRVSKQRGRGTNGHVSPRIRLDQAAAGHPNSRASLRSPSRTLRASQSWGSGGYAHGGGAGGGWHEYQPGQT